jgi:protein TonB
MIAVAAPRAELPRWAASAVVVLALHAMAGGALLSWRDPIGIGEPSTTIVVDLSPFRPPSDSMEDIAPGPPQQQAEAPPLPQEKVEPKVDEQVQPQIQDKDQVKVDVPPAPVPPVAALPPPTRQAPTPPPPPMMRPAPATTAPPRAHAARSDIDTWHGRILSQFERHKSYPPSAQSRGEKGVVQLAFSINREGQVVSSEVMRSSGHPSLDAEAVATARRAQPFPAPPADLAGARFDFTVPVRFNLR